MQMTQTHIIKNPDQQKEYLKYLFQGQFYIHFFRMVGEKWMDHVARPTAGKVEAPKREAPGMHPVHTKWWARMHRVHTELVGPASGEMRWDNCLPEFFLFDQGYNSKSIIV